MIRFKFITTSNPEYTKELCLRWEALYKPLGLPPGAEVCPEDVSGLHLLAVEKKEVVGCILFQPETQESGIIVQMAVAELKDHAGFARKLLHELERHLYEKGYREIKCKVAPDNLSYYEKLGFHKSPSGVSTEYQLYKHLHEAL